jgi:hypothetical protein
MVLMPMNRLIATVALPVVFAGSMRAGDLILKAEALAAWDQYIRTKSEGMRARLTPGGQFLWTDETADRRARVRGGEIVVLPATPQTPRKVPSGLIHDWMGAAFIADTNLDEVLSVVRDYSRYKDNYKPVVLDSKTISLGATASSGATEDRFSILLMNKSLISKTALDTEYKSSTIRLDPTRAWGTTESVRIQEIADYGTSTAHKLPPDEGSGLIWRLLSIARYQERDGGVYVELEAVALSREIPLSLRWMVDPIVRRVSRSSLATSIQQTKDALHSEAVLARRNAGAPRGAAQSTQDRATSSRVKPQ